MSYSKSGSFGWAGGGKAGATVDLWAASRFVSPPAEGTAAPSGSPDAGPVTTGTQYGNPGGYTVPITVIQDYYVRIQYGGVTYWGEVPAGSIAGQGLSNGAVVPINLQTASYVPVLGDLGYCIEINSSSPTTVTLNTGVFATGDTFEVRQVGTGTVTFVAGGGFTIDSYEGNLVLAGQWAEASVHYRSSSNAALVGNLT